MACSITITSVAGTVVGGNLDSIQVTGSTVMCDDVKVTLRCSGAIVQQTVQVLPGINTWAAIFTAAQVHICSCQSPITVSATCVNPNNPQCFATQTIAQLPCSPPCCKLIASVSTAATCTSGKRKVILDVLNNCPGIASAQWDFGDGSPLVSFPVGPGATQSVSHFYSPGNYTAVLHVPGCPDQNLPFTVDSCCPTAVFNVKQGNCNADGTQAATITAVVTPPSGGATIQAELVEGNTVLASGTSSGFSSLSLVYSGTFPSGSHTVCVRFLQPAGCGDQCTTFAVNCAGACCLPDGSCQEATTQQQCESQGGTYQGHGSACQNVTCTPGPPPECKKTFRKWFCPLLCALMTFLTGIGLALLILSLCPSTSVFGAVSNSLQNVGLYFLAAGAIALILFWIFCTKCICGWLYLFFWRVFFGVGVLITIFSGVAPASCTCACCCCPSMMWPGLGLILLGLLSLYLWQQHCKKTLCEVLSEVIIVMSVYIFPILAIIQSIPTATQCYLILYVINGFNVTFLILLSFLYAVVILICKMLGCKLS